MVLHIIKVLNKLLHVVLESPMGTRKIPEILCLMLVWQCYQAKMTMTKEGTVGNVVEDFSKQQIIYCTHTHLQVTHFVAL